MITVENINGLEYTVIDHVETAFMPGEWRLMRDGSLTLRDANGHCATALPALPYRIKSEHAPLLFLYEANGLFVRGLVFDSEDTADRLKMTDGEICDIVPHQNGVSAWIAGEESYDVDIYCILATHCVNAQGARCDVAIDDGETA